MNGHRLLIAPAAGLLLLVAVVGARADGDAGTFARLGFDGLPPYCQFQETAPLRGEYAERGLRFRGPAPLDGGGVLNDCSFFLVIGWTPPNLLGFNEGAFYGDGGVPRGPQTILLDEPADFVQASVGAAIEFFVQERPGAPAPARMAPRSAELAAAGDPVALVNLQEPRTMQPARYRSSDRGGRDLNLLVYTAIDPDDFNYDTDLNQALRSLDIPYTAIYANIPFFREALQEQVWDAVIFDHQLAFIYEYNLPVYDELLAHVRNGGRLIMSTWQIAERPDHPLWAELGFQWLENYDLPEPVAWTDAEPRFFTVPNDVPDFVELGDFYLTHGHRIAAAPDATVLARLIGRGQGADAMVLANGGRILYRAFMDGANVVDRDGDRVLDTTELWRDLLVQMQAEDVPWLSAPVEGVVPAGGAVDLAITFDATDLTPGDYVAQFELRTNETVHDTYLLPVALTVTSDPAAIETAAAAPTALRAYPNPFNPATTLAFALPEAGTVTLHLHDAAGRRVRTLCDGASRADGQHTVRWDGRDGHGRAVAAGVYLARLETAGRVLHERLVLAR